MKQILFIFLLAILKVGVLCSQNIMVVDMLDGMGQNIELSTESNITYNADSIIILPRTGVMTPMTFAISDVRKLFFLETNVTGKQEDIHSSCSVYPNPVVNGFFINGLDEGDYLLTIYSMDGKAIICRNYYYGERIDVSSLEPGVYIIQVGNYNGKFVKK